MKLYSFILFVITTFSSFRDLSRSCFPAQLLPETNNRTHYSELTAKKEINLLYQKLKSGYAFDKLAQQYSQDYGTYTVGGKLGWQEPDQFVSVFRKTVNGMAKTQFSKPFKTEFGYHIVQLLDRKEDKVLTRHILLKVKG